MVVGSFILILMGITQIQTVIMQGISDFYYIISTFTVGILLKIVINYICVGIPKFNIYGVIIGNCVWYLVPAILMHRKIKTHTKNKISMTDIIIKPILSSVIMGIVLLIIRILVNYIYRFISASMWVCMPILLFEVAVGGFIYVYVMVVIGGIKKHDIEEVSPKILSFVPAFMRRKLK